MGMRQTTPQGRITAYIEKQVERYERALFDALETAGKRCVEAAQNLPSPQFLNRSHQEIPPHQPNYIDWTANLRSSIGYVIVRGGEIIGQSSFKPVHTRAGASGDEGAAEGKAYAEQLAAKFPHGITLIVVAGMNYAAYVSAKGYDVLDSAELLAEKLVPQMMRQLSGKE